MYKNNYKITPYQSCYYNKLKVAYENVFQRIFLEKKQYEQRFSDNQKFSSLIVLNSDDKKVIGHVGFRVHNGNESICRRICFRYSTFLLPELRGSGVYQHLIEYSKDFLQKEFLIDLIYAWPNKPNLLSCLKDDSYINLPPITTWQKIVDNGNELIEDISDDFNPKFDKLMSNKDSLTNINQNEIEKIIQPRLDKSYYKVRLENQNQYALIGKSRISNRTYYSLIDYNNNSIESSIKKISNIQDLKNTCYLQLWCNYTDRELLRFIIKNGFEPSGPIFFRGVYILNPTKVNNLLTFPMMYHHDAF